MAVAGLLLGLASVTRSIGLPLLAILVVYLLIRRAGWRVVAAAVIACAVPVGSYVLWFQRLVPAVRDDGQRRDLPVCPRHDIRGLQQVQPARRREGALHVGAAEPPLAHPRLHLDEDAPLRRFPPPVFSPLTNMLAKGFATRAIKAEPLDYARVVWDDSWRSFAWKRQVFPDPITYGEYVSRAPAAVSRTEPATGHGFGNRFIVPRYADGSGITHVVAPYAGIMRGYQKYVFLPGTVLGVLLAMGLGGMAAAWRRFGGEILLPWAVAVAMIVVPAATAEFDYRYLLPVVPFACLAAAMVFGAGNPVGDWLAARRQRRRAARASRRQTKRNRARRSRAPASRAPSALRRAASAVQPSAVQPSAAQPAVQPGVLSAPMPARHRSGGHAPCGSAADGQCVRQSRCIGLRPDGMKPDAVQPDSPRPGALPAQRRRPGRSPGCRPGHRCALACPAPDPGRPAGALTPDPLHSPPARQARRSARHGCGCRRLRAEVDHASAVLAPIAGLPGDHRVVDRPPGQPQVSGDGGDRFLAASGLPPGVLATSSAAARRPRCALRPGVCGPATTTVTSPRTPPAAQPASSPRLPRRISSWVLVSSRHTTAGRPGPKDCGQLAESAAEPPRRFEEHQGARLVREFGETARAVARSARRKALEAEAVAGQACHGEGRRHRGRPGQGGHPDSRRGRRLDHPVAGIADTGHSGVGHKQNVAARLQLGQQPLHPPLLYGLVTRHDRSRQAHPKVGGEPADPPGVLGRYHASVGERVGEARGSVACAPDRRGGDEQGARDLFRSCRSSWPTTLAPAQAVQPVTALPTATRAARWARTMASDD